MPMCKVLWILLVISLTFTSFTSCKEKSQRNKKRKEAKAPEWKLMTKPAKGENFVTETLSKKLKLDCSASGYPKPNITWFKDGKEIIINKRGRMKIQKKSLIIKSLLYKDTGNYTCVLQNAYGHLDFTYVLDVRKEVTQLEVEGPVNATAHVGDTVTFQCRVSNDPIATIKWLQQKQLGKAGRMRTVTEFVKAKDNMEVLRLVNVTLNDTGKYTCLAGNRFMLKYKDAWLTVVKETQPATQTTAFHDAKPVATTSLQNMNTGETDIDNANKNNGTATNFHESHYPAVVSIWTIYIVVASVSGGVLLIGLISIIVAVCCQKERMNTYKSTSV